MLDQTKNHAQRLRDAADEVFASGATGIKSLSSGKSDTFKLNPYLITVEQGFNARDFSGPDTAGIAELAQSIATHGVLKPLTCRLSPAGNSLLLVDGERRLRATLHAIGELGAAIETVPVQMEQRGVNDADRLASQVTHNSGRAFTDLELGSVVKRLAAYGWDSKRIEQQTGVAQSKQAMLMHLLTAPADVQDRLRAGEVSSDAIYKTIRHSKPEEVSPRINDAIERVKREGRKRATASDIVGNEPTLVKLMQLLYEECYRGDQVTEEDGCVTITFSPAQWAIMSRRFGIKV